MSDAELVLHRPVDDLPVRQRELVLAWLHDHGVDPDRVALHRPVRRFEESSSLSWPEERDGGVVLHRCFPAVGAGVCWPAPFPSGLLEESADETSDVRPRALRLVAER